MERVIDIFGNDVFKVTSLQRLVDKVPFVPQALGQMRIFQPKPIADREVLLFEKDGGYQLIPSRELGAPDAQQIRRQGRVRALSTIPLGKMDTVRAGELQSVASIALPERIRLQNAQDLTVERMAQLRTDLEATKEFHRLNALQGKLYDADGTTLLVDFFTEYGIAEPSAINFDFSAIANNQLGTFVEQNVRNPMRDVLKDAGRWGPQVKIHCLVGDTFWYSLIAHNDIVARWQAQETARYIALAQNPLLQTPTYSSVEVGNVVFHHYEGTTAGDIDVGTNDAIFFPVGAKDVFNVYWSPGETNADVNQKGRAEYPYIVPDMRPAIADHVDMHLRSYPLYACIFPQALLKGLRTG